METKKVYIAGPVSGLDYETARANFRRAENAIKERYGALVEVVNPMVVCRKDWSWEQCMRVCVVQLAGCDYIYLLEGWEKSKGARLEKAIAEGIGVSVFSFSF